MSLIHSSADHLPYIDEVNSESLGAARALITAELEPPTKGQMHPNLGPEKDIKYSDLINAEHEILAEGKERTKAIDLGRYEEPAAPEDGSVTTAWRAAFVQAYTASEYLSGRLANLGLLETYGKNAWLVGNSQAEDVLRDLERDVVEAKSSLETLDAERRARQMAAGAEMQSLEEAWRLGVGRHIEVLATNERLRLEILDRKRIGAV